MTQDLEILKQRIMNQLYAHYLNAKESHTDNPHYPFRMFIDAALTPEGLTERLGIVPDDNAVSGLLAEARITPCSIDNHRAYHISMAAVREIQAEEKLQKIQSTEMIVMVSKVIETQLAALSEKETPNSPSWKSKIPGIVQNTIATLIEAVSKGVVKGMTGS